MNKPTFGLADIPEDWWIRLNDSFVEDLDKLNRPWPHEKGGYGKKRGRGRGGRNTARYWEAGQLHTSSFKRMTPEEQAGYKRRLSLFEKLWGRHRYKDYHFAVDDPRRYVDSGPWIRKTDIAVLREGIDIVDSELEKTITGFRQGKWADLNVREMLFPRLPIVADKWWAWIFGYWFSNGNAYRYTREGPHTRKGGYTTIYLHLRAANDVLPKLLEVSRHIGAKAIVYTFKDEYRFRGKGIQKMGVGSKELVVLGWPEYIVLTKFGLEIPVLDEFEDRRGMQLRASGYKPKIPGWIKDDDECMKFFIEGYIAGGKGISTLAPVSQASARSYNLRKRPNLHIMVKATGKPEEYIKRFVKDMHKWFEAQGCHTVFRKGFSPYPDRTDYVIELNTKRGRDFLLDNFEIVKSDMRARALISRESDEDRVLYEILRVIRTPENVILGLLLEQPLTPDDIRFLLRMTKKAVASSLIALQKREMIERRGAHYFYAPEGFAKRLAEQYEDAAESMAEKTEKYLDRLLYQCQICRHVFITQKRMCGYCGGKVKPVPRSSVVASLEGVRRYNMYLSRSLKG